MSRISKNPLTIPEGVDLTINGKDVKAKGKLGELSLKMVDEVNAKVDNGTVIVEKTANTKFANAMWATTWRLINNLCVGVSQGFEKNLEINGVGYRAQAAGQNLTMQLGFSHEVKYEVPAGVKVEVEKQTAIKVTGIDKQLVGQVAAEIREFKKPEPYKGKGIKYSDERIVRKEGKKK
jgi:large subunit ribosomal protein L6